MKNSYDRFLTKTKSLFKERDKRKSFLRIFLPIFFILLFAAAILALLYGFEVFKSGL